MKVEFLTQSFISFKMLLRGIVLISFISLIPKFGFSQEGQIFYIPIEIRGTFNFYQENGKTTLKKLFPESKNSENHSVKFKLSGGGFALGRDYLVEFRSLSGEGTFDPFFFGSNSDDIATATGMSEINQQSIFYSPQPDSFFTYGFGISSYKFIFALVDQEELLKSYAFRAL